MSLSLSAGNPLAAEEIHSIWLAQDGNWSLESGWTSEDYPHNAAPDTYNVEIHQGTVTVDVPVQINNFTYGGDVLQLEESLQVESLLLLGGGIYGPGSLSITGDVELRGGTINNTNDDGFHIGGTVYKRGFGRANISPFDGSGDYPIVIEQGSLRYGNGGLGTTVGDVSIASPQYARLLTMDTKNVSDDVYLNNATGFAYGGALLTQQTRGSILGDIYLGDQRAIIGVEGSGSRMTIYSNIHGGTLEIAGRGLLELEGNTHTYTGATRVGIHGESTILRLAESGRLSATSSQLVIGQSAAVWLHNDSDTVLGDRIPDSMPIYFHGGTLEVDGGPLTETLGAVTLVRGTSAIRSATGSPLIVLDSITRQGTAGVVFGGLDNVEYSETPRIKVSQATTLVNDIIGPWAIAGDIDFVSYDSELGLLPLGNRVNRPTQINSAGALHHVSADAAQTTLTGDRTIYSLRSTVEGAIDFNLGGHRLTVASGGLIRSGYSTFSSEIKGGTLTAGVSSAPAELFIHTHRAAGGSTNPSMTISAQITDNAFGGAVGLTASGNATLELSGVNTYSGPTTIHEGRISILSADALPAGTPLTLNGGDLRFNFFQDQPTMQFGQLRLEQGGTIYSVRNPLLTYVPAIDAPAYHLESGAISVPLSGAGVIEKTTEGTVSLEGDSTNFSGDIFVRQGVLAAGALNSAAAYGQFTLGTGRTQIDPNGTLVHSSAAGLGIDNYRLNADLLLNGGTIGLHANNDNNHWIFEGSIDVVGDSRLLLFDPTGDDYLSDPDVTFYGQLALADNSKLNVLSQGHVTTYSPIALSGTSSIDLEQADAKYHAIVANSPISTLNLQGKGLHILPLALNGNGENQLLVRAAAGTRLQGSSLFSINSGATLVVDGQFTSPSLQVDAGTLRGNGVLDSNVVNEGMVVGGGFAGESHSTLTIRGDYDQESLGRLQIDLADSEFDRLIISGEVKLAGGLDVSLDPEYTPTLGEYFEILTSSSLEGYFEETNGTVFDQTTGLAVLYEEDHVALRVSLRGDFDLDDDVDTADLTTMFQNFNGAGNSGQFWLTGDTDGDGDVDTADITTAFQNFTGAGSASVVETSSVPEPSSVVLLMFGGLALVAFWNFRGPSIS